MTALWVLLLLLVAAFDFLKRRIPNGLVLAGAVLGLGALDANLQPFGLGWSAALGGAVVGFGVLLMFYAAGVMGAADVKVAGVLGLWVGAAPLLPIWLLASVLAGVHSLMWVALQRWPVLPQLANMLSAADTSPGVAGRPIRRQRHVPLAAYLAIATLLWMAAGGRTGF